jgi:uncharacterized protein
MFVLALEVDLHIGHAQSLKDKRGVIRSIVDGARNRFHVASAEVGDQNKWQRARLGFAAVSSSQQHTTEVIDEVSRFVWSFPEIEVLSEERTWLS